MAAALHHGRVGRLLLAVSLTLATAACWAAEAADAYTTAGPRWPGRVRLVLVVPSVAVAYVIVQAGYLPGGEVFPYAWKTLVSGTGMPVLFKEVVPAWLGLDTLHLAVSRPEVSAADLARALPTAEGLVLIRNQALMLLLSAAAFAAVAFGVVRVWRAPALAEARP